MGPVKLEKLGMVHVFPFTTPLNIDPDLRRCGVGLVFFFHQVWQAFNNNDMHTHTDSNLT